MGKVVALMDDLFFQAKILETAKHVGVRVETVTSGEALVAAGSLPDGERPVLVLVDLNARSGAVDAIEKLRAAGNQVPVVAFLSHVQVELAERAKAAGATQVLPRSRFAQNLPSILSQAKDK
jgi:CheY-like chemotaxis protein